MKVEVRDGKLIITLDLQPPTPGATGKAMAVASPHGKQTATATIYGKPITVGVNAPSRRQWYQAVGSTASSRPSSRSVDLASSIRCGGKPPSGRTSTLTRIRSPPAAAYLASTFV